MMKRIVILLAVVCLLLSGCAALGELAKPKEAVFTIDSYHLQITADSTFQEKTGGSFDLQITNGNAYISIMAYDYIDLPQDVTTLDVFDMQNEDLLSKRTNVTVIEDAKTETISQHRITQALFSAEKDGVKNYYASYLIDLPREETFAWVLVSATPSYLKNNREYLNTIVCSLSAVQ